MEYNDLFVLIISQQILFQNLIANFSVGVSVASSFVMLSTVCLDNNLHINVVF